MDFDEIFESERRMRDERAAAGQKLLDEATAKLQEYAEQAKAQMSILLRLLQGAAPNVESGELKLKSSAVNVHGSVEIRGSLAKQGVNINLSIVLTLLVNRGSVPPTYSFDSPLLGTIDKPGLPTQTFTVPTHCEKHYPNISFDQPQFMSALDTAVRNLAKHSR